MRAGIKDRRIQLQTLTITKSATGAPIETWATYKEMYAAIMYLPVSSRLAGDEKYASNEIASEIEVTFKISYIPGINTKSYRVSYNGTIYDIRHIVEIGRHEAWELRCKAFGV